MLEMWKNLLTYLFIYLFIYYTVQVCSGKAHPDVFASIYFILWALGFAFGS